MFFSFFVVHLYRRSENRHPKKKTRTVTPGNGFSFDGKRNVKSIQFISILYRGIKSACHGCGALHNNRVEHMKLRERESELRWERSDFLPIGVHKLKVINFYNLLSSLFLEWNEIRMGVGVTHRIACV